jgi:hypothetical protein
MERTQRRNYSYGGRSMWSLRVAVKLIEDNSSKIHRRFLNKFKVVKNIYQGGVYYIRVEYFV